MMNPNPRRTPRRLIHIVLALGGLAALFVVTRSGDDGDDSSIESNRQPNLSAVIPKRQLTEREAMALQSKPEYGEVPFEQLYEERSANVDTWHEEGAEFYRAWGEAEGAVAAEHARREGGASATALAGSALAGWAGRDLVGAQTWVDAMHDGREKMLLARAVIAVIPESPKGPGEWVANLATSNFSAGLLTGVAKDIAGEESDSNAIDWISELPDGRSRDQALQRVVADWTHQDPRSVSEKLSTMERGMVKDRAISIFCQRIASEDATSARQWAESIGDEEVRDTTIAMLDQMDPQ